MFYKTIRLFKTLIINKYFLFTLLFLIVGHTIYTAYTPVVNSIKYNYLSYKIESSINNISEKVLDKRKKEMEYEKVQKIREIEKYYILKEAELETNYKNIIEDSIKENKAILKDNITKGYRINNNIVGKIRNIYSKNFYNVLVNENEIKEIVFNDYKENFHLEKAKTYVFNDINILNYLSGKEIKEEKAQNFEIKKEKKEKKVIRSTKLEIINKKVLDSGILILDKSKIENLLPYGINFPSFFSYKMNNIKMSSNYYDLHYGVDYKTRPITYINLKFFKGKEGKVYKTFNDSFGKRIYLITKNERFEYLHLNKIYVKEGDIINSETDLGQTGNSGLSTGPHLHFNYIKDGFYVPYDWGLDFDNKKTLIKVGLSDIEANKFIIEGKGDIINMESVLGIYLNIKDRKIENISEIKEIIRKSENKGQFSLNEILQNPFFKEKLLENKTAIQTAAKARKTIDSFHIIKKKVMLGFLKENKKISKNITLFDIKMLGNGFFEKNKKVKTSNSKDFKINFGECNNYKSNVYSKYKNKIITNDTDFLQPYAIKNINKIAPLILKSIENNNIIDKIRKVTSDKITINKCDILYIELGKWYQEHTFYLDNPNNYGLFQNTGKNYNYEFPKEKGKKELSDTQYNKQIIDSLLFSIDKLKYKTKSNWNNRNNVDDFLLKYWLWSYHGLIGNNPDKDFYVSNNLLYKDLPIKDISSTRKTAYKDGGFTIATKFYLFVNNNK